MNVERTIEFLLDHAAKGEARFDRLEANQAKLQNLLRHAIRWSLRRERSNRAEIRALAEAQRRTDHKVGALTEMQLRTDRKIEALVEGQLRTDRKFNRLIDALLKAGGDGHGR